jgi:hypothetical protein
MPKIDLNSLVKLLTLSDVTMTETRHSSDLEAALASDPLQTGSGAPADGKRMTIIVTKGSLDWAYPPFILDSGDDRGRARRRLDHVLHLLWPAASFEET